MADLPLHKIPLWQNLDAAEIKAVENFLINKKYKQGEYLIRARSARDKIIIINSGLAALRRQTAGEIFTLAMFQAHDVIGEMALIADKTKHDYDLLVVSPVVHTAELGLRQWHSLIRKQPKLALKIYRNIANNLHDRLTHSNNKLYALYCQGYFSSLADSEENLARQTVPGLLSVIPSMRAAWLSYNQISQKVQIIYSHKFSPSLKSSFYLNQDVLLEFVSKSPEPIIIDKTSLPAKFKSSDFCVAPLLITALKTKDECVGFLLLSGKTGNKKYSLNNQILIKAVAHNLAFVVKQIRERSRIAGENYLHRPYIDPFN